MNLVNVREGMINVLLQQCDARDVLIAQLQTENTQLKAKLEAPAPAPAAIAEPAAPAVVEPVASVAEAIPAAQ